MVLRLLQFTIKVAVPRIRLGNVAFIHHMEKIGNREIVGYGWNGSPCYQDWSKIPFPSIRFRETTPEIEALREKEKCDWTSLDLYEKRTLYRASFCQTFSEFQTTEQMWKRHVGYTCMVISCAIWVYYLLNVFVYDELPDTFTEEKRKAQLKRMIDLQVNVITGVSSKWDYENEKWKK